MRFFKGIIKKYIPYFSDFINNNHYLKLVSKRIGYENKNNPEELLYKFIKNSPKVYIDCTESKKLLEVIRDKSNKVFFVNKNNHLFKVASNIADNLLETTSTKLLEDEIYRFLVNPLECIPEVLELVLTESFQNIFAKIKLLKLANVHLRLSSPNHFEKHTTI